MQLYISLTSPFARKVRVAVIEKQLEDRIENVVLDPWSSPDALIALNPLSQVPTLVTDDGVVVGNSDTVLDVLEHTFPEPALLPAANDTRTRALAVAALAHGMIEATVQIVIERRKPVQQQGEAIVERRLEAIGRTLDVLPERFDAATDRFHLDGVGVACALSYLDLRLPDLDWRSRQPALAKWHAWAAERPSMKATAPPA